MFYTSLATYSEPGFLHSKIADRTERASDKSSKLEVVLYTTLTSY